MSIAENITSQLRQKALSHAPGERLPSVRGLMSRYGASLHSVNIALRQLEAEGLITTKKGSGIYINGQKGVRYIELHRPQYPSTAMDIKEISLERAIARAGWKFLIKRHPVHGDDPDFRPTTKACAHVIMPTIFEANPSFFSQIMSQSAPVVAYGRVSGPFQLDYVTGDDHKYMSLLVKHLRGLGHQRLALLDNEPASFALEQRGEIFQNIIDLFDLPKPVIIDCGTQRGESSLLKGYEGLKNHLGAMKGKPAFTALVVASSAGILGALRAFHEAGLQVPKDCSLAAFGTIPENALTIPSITDVGVADESWGEGVVEVLKQRFADPKATPFGVKLAPQLFERESTTPPGKSVNP